MGQRIEWSEEAWTYMQAARRLAPPMPWDNIARDLGVGTSTVLAYYNRRAGQERASGPQQYTEAPPVERELPAEPEVPRGFPSDTHPDRIRAGMGALRPGHELTMWRVAA